MKEEQKVFHNITKADVERWAKKNNNQNKSTTSNKKIGAVLFYLCHNFLIKGDKKKTLSFLKGRTRLEFESQMYNSVQISC